MPTNDNESLIERYKSEEDIELSIYSRLSDVQIRSIDFARHNAEVQNEILSELVKNLSNALTEIKNLENTIFNEWDAVERVIPSMCKIAAKALAAVNERKL